MADERSGRPERPLLLLPTPTAPEERSKKSGGPGRFRVPGHARQTARIEPRLGRLAAALETRRLGLASEPVGAVPEEVIVLEIVGRVDNFINAVGKVQGLEWLAEVELDDLPPDDDFALLDARGADRSDKGVPRRLFLVMTDQQALQEILSLWARWKRGDAFDHGFAKWRNVFTQLNDVRPWGVKDRLLATGVLEDWMARAATGQVVLPCEIELWYRLQPARRDQASLRVRKLIDELGGEVLHEAVLDDIAYHALLTRLPADKVSAVLEGAPDDIELLLCEQVQFVRATGQLATGLAIEERIDDSSWSGALPDSEQPPVVALLDGLPLQGHARLDGRVIIDDPDRFSENYRADERIHGTAMASLILHGELDDGGPPLSRRIYVRPILRPSRDDWRNLREEASREDQLLVDLVHRAVMRMFDGEGEEGPAAPTVRVINLSIGLRNRLFDTAMSPLARLLDWLAWKYKVLFVVAAGNHYQPIDLGPGPIPEGVPRDARVLQQLQRDAPFRRLRSPSEAMNAVTVAAVHADASAAVATAPAIEPYSQPRLPSVINAQGLGYRRSVKPEVILAGGRVTLRAEPDSESFAPVPSSRAPGQRVAAPGAIRGNLTASAYVYGTSGATALATRVVAFANETVEALADEPGGEVLRTVPDAVWLKCLLVHGARWGGAGDALEQALLSPETRGKWSEFVTRFLGYGEVDMERVRECTPRRVTALAGGVLGRDEAHSVRFPLPPSLSARRGLRTVAATLAWFSPVNPLHQGWRRADLWVSTVEDPLRLAPSGADTRTAQRGTVQHSIFSSVSAVPLQDDADLRFRVSCRPDAGKLDEQVPYALAVTLEIDDAMEIDIYSEVRARVEAARIQIRPGA